jgi:homogentisate 1,2-dioxygenase
MKAKVMRAEVMRAEVMNTISAASAEGARAGGEEGEGGALSYLRGFGNEHESEALPGALPVGQNSPQRCPYGLYAEQLSGSAFTAPRHHNLRSWLYRIRPTARNANTFEQVRGALPDWVSAPPREGVALPLSPRRWGPLPLPAPSERVHFLEGLKTLTVAGDVASQAGLASMVYVANASMGREALMNADAEMMILPQLGALRLRTELGLLDVGVGELAVVPRGVVFSVDLLGEGGEGGREGGARGYVCENYGAPFTLPELGPIGANGSASARDFLYPVASFEDLSAPHALWARWGGRLFRASLERSPFDVVAWHGRYAPYKYNLRQFAPIGSISVDHPDPSIFTVLTSPSHTPGVANADFVLFSDRWLVAEHTFRPPWYHRNLMSEFMGLLYGRYDAKEEGFVPGGASLHTSFMPHGPDASGFEKASAAALSPQRLSGTMAFMWETRLPQHTTLFASEHPALHRDYTACWAPLKVRFNGEIEGDWS